MRFRFPASARLKRKSEFEAVRARGARHRGRWLVLNEWHGAPGEGRKLGIITTRKLGGAVARNRTRRLVREVFRLNQHRLVPGCHLVVIVRPEAVGKTCASVEKDFLDLCRRAGILDKKTT